MKEPQVLGAQDLATLWDSVQIGSMNYKLAVLPQGVGIKQLSDHLRSRAWRVHCPNRAQTCVERPLPQRRCDRPSTCTADCLFPLDLTGGKPPWRMASAFVRWSPGKSQLTVWQVGAVGEDMLAWIDVVLRERLVLPVPELRTGRLSQLAPTSACRLRAELQTPWVLGKRRLVGSDPAADADADIASDFEHRLRDSLLRRGQKFTALCLQESLLWTAAPDVGKRLLAFAARYVGEASLAGGLRLAACDLTRIEMELTSRSNGRTVPYQCLTGDAWMELDDVALPWLRLWQVCGAGEAPDEGWGAVELTTMP